jgi:NADPH:quinone reductase-like Zn-dependent oxidoreductase
MSKSHGYPCFCCFYVNDALYSLEVVLKSQIAFESESQTGMKGVPIMKAIVLHQPGSFEQLKYEEVDSPLVDKNQVLIKVRSASVNFADVMTRRGTYPTMPPLPAIPGNDCSGIVESVGEKVTQFRPGQPVAAIGRGCYADYMVTSPLAVFSISELDPALMARSAEILFKYLADKRIKPHIYERLPLSEAARAHKLLESGKVQGKLILKPGT